MPAKTMPMSTAMMRSTETVMAAVTTNATASARVDRTIERTVATCTMRTAVTMRTPDSAASGIAPTGPAATSTIASSTRAWTTTDTRVRPPARTFTAVRAIAPVAGIPPKKPEPMDARPCPTSSRSGS